MRKSPVLAAVLAALFSSVWCKAAQASAYDAKPKLVIILVLDQFRGDYPDRYRADFKTKNGFNLFLKQGAYFPDCYYDYADTVTAAGHSTIGTGAYTNGHNIHTNDWYDLERSSTHLFSSVEDDRYPLVGTMTGAAAGASPRNELASTLGDEVVLATGGRAKLFGVSMKDRAAILTSGHASQGAFWVDHATGAFISSTYWYKELPSWVTAFNASGQAAQARKEAGVPTGDFYEQVGKSPAAVKYEMNFTKALIEAEKLGKHDVTDVLTISISSTDIVGHDVGPDATQQRALIGATDVILDEFFTWLNAHVDGGLNNVWVALSGDHGVAPNPLEASKEGMPAASFAGGKLNAELDRELNAKLSPGKSTRYILGGDLPYIQLHDRAFASAKVKEADAEGMVAAMLPAALDATQVDLLKAPPDNHVLHAASVRHVYTKVQIAAGEVPNTEEGRLILHSYSTNGGWWVMLTPGMYQMSGHGAAGTTHFTPYSYDRHVPLGFYGNAFVPGTYFQRAAPVDIAATFAALLRINQPSSSVGRVVTEAIRPEAAATTQFHSPAQK